MRSFMASERLQVCVESLGAELCSVKSRHDGLERLWQGDPRSWSRRAPILFPIVGRLSGDRYLAGGNEYVLAQHGFARDREFKLIESGPARLLYRLSSDEESLKAYPFQFELMVRYELDGGRLEVAYGVANAGSSRMFFSIGAHPGFACPPHPGERFEEYELVFEKKETARRHFLQGGLLTGESAPLLEDEDRFQLSGSLFERDALIFKGLRSTWAAMQRKGGGRRLNVHFEGWPYLGIWTKPGAPFLCIEPWQGLADRAGAPGRLEEKEGILALEPGGLFQRSFFITVDEE